MSDIIHWPSATNKGYMEAVEGDGVVIERPWVARGTVQSQVSPTLTTSRGGGAGVCVPTPGGCRLTENVCIRYITEREAFRLMGQTDDAIDRIMETEKAKTRLYEMAGNSIVVDVLVDIFKAIYIDKSFGKREKRPSLEDFFTTNSQEGCKNE